MSPASSYASSSPGLSWVAVVPVKELAVAKSRLAELGDAARRDLALACAQDVVSCARATPGVLACVVVTNDLIAAAALEALGARVVADVTDSGLDDALAAGARQVGLFWQGAGVVALPADLACALPAELAALLTEAGGHARSVLADGTGDGTTVLTALNPQELKPSYGPGSRARHVDSGAWQLDRRLAPSLVHDVDAVADLAPPAPLVLGPHTAAAARAHGVGPPAS